MKKKIQLFILSTFVFSSCTNHSEDDLTTPKPDATYKYTVQIKPIIDANCIFCHGTTPSNGAPMSLVTYEQVKEAVLNRNLIGKISKSDGEPGLMPFVGPRLPQASIDAIDNWKNEGLNQ